MFLLFKKGVFDFQNFRGCLPSSWVRIGLHTNNDAYNCSNCNESRCGGGGGGGSGGGFFFR
jgi:hypothetical protein